MNIGVIGCGSIGSRHARNLVALGHRPWLYDVRPVGQPATGCTITNRLDDLACHVEAVLICTPAHTHTSVLRQLGECGYAGPVFVEKPICDTLADAKDWRDWPHPVVMVGYNLRFHHALLALRASVRRPTAGEFYLDCDMRQWPGRDYGMILTEGSHELDAALFCGAPARVGQVDILTTTRATFWLDKDIGARWLIDLDGDCQKYLRHWALGSPSQPDQSPVRFTSPEVLGDEMYLDELAHFLRAVEGGPIAPGCTREEGIVVLDVIEQVRRLGQ